MTECSLLPPNGDRGQRFEIRFVDGNGIERVLGWCEEAGVAAMVGAVTAHPVWKCPRVVDRRATPILSVDQKAALELVNSLPES